MIEIVNSPTYSAGGFDYNVVGALSTVSYQIRSLQAKIANIQADQNWASVALRSNINTYLTQVKTTTGRNPQIYIEDNTGVGFSYTGIYEVNTMTLVGGNSRLQIRLLGSDSPTYHGSKSFPDNNNSQVVYQYRPQVSYEVYDVSTASSITDGVLLTTRRQQLSASGYNWFNASELAKGYVYSSGGVALQIKITITDFFGNAETIETDPCIFVQARVPDINYGDYVLFNPKSGGHILPTTGYQLLYSDKIVYPFYVNFIINDQIPDNTNMKLEVQFFSGSTLIDTQFADIDFAAGLNVVDISKIQPISNAITSKKPSSIKVSVMHSSLVGEFIGAEFNNSEFDIERSGASGRSQAFTISCRKYTLDNRRDFYFSYQNGIGGLSTGLCTEYRRITRPEVVALRNASVISNSVARESEYAELIFKYADLKKIFFLLGYKPDLILKGDGIYESLNVERIGANGERLLWIIQAADYDIENSIKYKDLAITIYRPIGAEYQTTHR